MKTFFLLSRLEGIILALENTHTVAYAELAKRELVRELAKGDEGKIVIGGGKNMDFAMERHGALMNMRINELLTF